MAARGGEVTGEASSKPLVSGGTGDVPHPTVSGDVEVGQYLEIAEAKAMAGGPVQTEPAPGQPTASPQTARDAVAILDFGSQYSQLIARRVREAQVYCELLPHDVTPQRLSLIHI